LVQTIAPTEPDSAWTWARSIAQDELRFEAMANAIAAMTARDPAAGRAALVELGGELPPDIRTSLEGLLEGRPGARPTWLKAR